MMPQDFAWPVDERIESLEEQVRQLRAELTRLRRDQRKGPRNSAALVPAVDIMRTDLDSRHGARMTRWSEHRHLVAR